MSPSRSSSWSKLLPTAALIISGANGLNPCLDAADTVYYRCTPGTTRIVFGYSVDTGNSCQEDLVDADLPDIQACFDSAGRDVITDIELDVAVALTSFPVGMFANLPALEKLTVGSSDVLTELEVGLFDNVAGSLLELKVTNFGALTSLPVDLFRSMSSLTYLGIMNIENLESLPVGLFEDTTEVVTLVLYGNELPGLELGVFDGLTKVETLALQYNAFTTLPAGIFEPLTSLENMWFHGYDMRFMQCLPDSTAANIRLQYESTRDGTCECTPDEAVSCAEGTTCSPGTSGYTCEGTSEPVPEPTPTPDETDPTPEPTPATADETCGTYADIAGIVGTSSGGTVCCPVGCGTCGGTGCGQNEPDGLGVADCCVSRIIASDQYCSDTGATPCIIDDGADEVSAMAADTQDEESEEASAAAPAAFFRSNGLFAAAAIAVGASATQLLSEL